MMSNDTNGTVTFYHKGGDWVKFSDLKIIISNQTYETVFRAPNSSGLSFNPVPIPQNLIVRFLIWGEP